MKIKSAEFVKGIKGTNKIQDDMRPQVAFVGRSNVGKSSVINSLVNRKQLVKSGNKPGKTTEINYFLINSNTFFVDLPGYGYAKASLQQREKVRRMILWFLFETDTIFKKVVLIVDIRVGLTEFDEQMLQMLKKSDHPFVIVANKSDKLKKKEINKKLLFIQEKTIDCDVVVHSAKTKQGRQQLLENIF